MASYAVAAVSSFLTMLHVDDPADDPHEKRSELLVFQGREPPANPEVTVKGVKGTRAKVRSAPSRPVCGGRALADRRLAAAHGNAK